MVGLSVAVTKNGEAYMANPMANWGPMPRDNHFSFAAVIEMADI